MSPNYSVLISVYYKERPIYLKSALDSVLNQTLPPSEIILIKDGPLTVELEKVLSSYDTNLLKIIPLPNNLGSVSYTHLDVYKRQGLLFHI